MKNIADFNFKAKKVVMRVDFNVPLDKSFQITDDKRMREAVPSIKKILNDGGSVVLLSHLGRPKGGFEEKYSLKHLQKHLAHLLEVAVHFADDCAQQATVEKAKNLAFGEVLLVENLRFYAEEEKGDVIFAEKLAQLGDFYVNDAFGTAHRAHASTSVMAQFFPNKKCFGYLILNELKSAQKLLQHAEKPFVAIMGGAKISDKILLIDNLLPKVDYLLIGGGMAYTFFKAMGGNIGKSLLEIEQLDLAKSILARAKEKNVQLILPKDSVVAGSFSNEVPTKIADNFSIDTNDMGLDIGPKAIAEFSEIISKAKSILWNGPMGVFEMSNFENGTKKVAEAIVSATENGAFSLIGGGDSAAAIAKFGFEQKVSYVSTGGGALLEYMEGKILPGIAAIEAN